MCGLVGLAGLLEFKDEATIKRMLVLDYFRGTDSTGLASIRNNGDIKISKMATHPFNLFDSKKFTETLSGYNSRALIGHNRAATIGKTNDLNAHPFQFGSITGAHNGTLDRPSWVRLEQAAGIETDVDSAAIFACIDKIGIEDTIKLMEEGKQGSTGAWALVWYDDNDGTLNFLRNKHRPLWYAYSKDFKKVLWASEWPMIRAATDLSNNAYELYADAEGYSYWEMAENKWYSFDLKELVKGSDKRPKPIVKTLKGREPAQVAPVGQAPFTAGRPKVSSITTPTQQHRGGTTISTTFHGEMSATSCETPPLVDLIGSASSPLSNVITEVRFNDMAQHGCGWCGEDVNYTDIGVTVLDAYDTVMCPSCSKNGDHTRVYYGFSDYEDWFKWKAA